MAESEILRAPHVLEYPYIRSVGPVIGAFLTGLREGRILGAQSRDAEGTATVIVPPTEYDPITSADVGELVEVGQAGVVTTWAWAADPKKDQPLDRPFAWALVRLDGATTAMLHVVDAGSADAMSSGMRVTARSAPGRANARVASRTSSASCPRGATHDRLEHPHRLRHVRRGSRHDARHTDAPGLPVHGGPVAVAVPAAASHRASSSASAVPRVKGLRPSAGSCPTDGVATTEEVELGNKGTVTTYCVVNVPFQGQSIEIPYICAQILLDGANIAFMGLIQELPADQVRMGMRVEAVWLPKEQWGLTMASVKYFRPNGEPDADYETFKEYL